MELIRHYGGYSSWSPKCCWLLPILWSVGCVLDLVTFKLVALIQYESVIFFWIKLSLKYASVFVQGCISWLSHEIIGERFTGRVLQRQTSVNSLQMIRSLFAHASLSVVTGIMVSFDVVFIFALLPSWAIRVALDNPCPQCSELYWK